MSFLSCIGKRSKKKKSGKEPVDKRSLDNVKASIEEVEVPPTITEESGAKTTTTTAKPTTPTSTSSDKAVASPSNATSDKANQPPVTQDIDKLQAEVSRLSKENELFKEEADRYEASVKSLMEDVHRLESANLAIKTKLTITDAESSRITLENQRLVQKIVGMEENQAMLSRAELQNLISQLEESEHRPGPAKPSTTDKLSGIRTNPVATEPGSRKKMTQTQEDRHITWKLSKAEARLSRSEEENKQLRSGLNAMLGTLTLSKAEARLSRSEEENKQLRSDLKEMLDTHSELQQQIVSDEEITNRSGSNSRSSFSISSDRVSIASSSSSSIEPSSPQLKPATNGDHTDDLLDRLVRAEMEQNCLKNDYDTLLSSFNDLQNRVSESETENEALKEKCAKMQDLQALVGRLSEQEEEQRKRKNEISSLECVFVTLNTRVDQLAFENNVYQGKNEDLNIQNRNFKNQVEKLQNDIQNLRDANKKITEENKKLSQQQQKRKDTAPYSNTDDSILNELSDLKHKYEESNKRLKEITSQPNKPLTPQIKNLDLLPSTPGTIGERFRRELYERKWREALTYMTGPLKKEEKKSVQILGEICTEAYLFCKRAARQQVDTLTSSLLTPTSNHYRSSTLNKRNGVNKSLYSHLPEDLRRRLFYFRTQPTQEAITAGCRDFLNQIDYDRTRFLRHISERELHEISSYTTTCFEICWCMAVQDPPMYLLFKVKHGLEVDETRFDRYHNKAGRKVDYVVWPAVFAEENGQCLQRGVIHTLPERA